MEVEKLLDLEALTESYLFANTPGYLYRHFRRNSSIEQLIKQVPIQVLIKEYNARAIRKELLKEVVTAYSILIAFTFLDYQEALQAFEKTNLALLDWGNEIKALFVFNTPSTNSYTETISSTTPSKLKIAEAVKAETATYSSVNFKIEVNL